MLLVWHVKCKIQYSGKHEFPRFFTLLLFENWRKIRVTGSLGWDIGYDAKGFLRVTSSQILSICMTIFSWRFSEEGPHRSDIQYFWAEVSYPPPRRVYTKSISNRAWSKKASIRFISSVPMRLQSLTLDVQSKICSHREAWIFRSNADRCSHVASLRSGHPSDCTHVSECGRTP